MIEQTVEARQHFAGQVRTALAAPIVGDAHSARSVGPVVFVAHVLPMSVEPGALQPDFDVRPHPHIGLSAITYMLQGYVTHRDSLGSRAEVGPGGMNYMIAGRGVVHSERFDRLRTLGGCVELLQILLALPDDAEEMEPGFTHIDAKCIPEFERDGTRVRSLLGQSQENRVTVRFPQPAFLQDVTLEPGGCYRPPNDYPERAVYVLEGKVEIDGMGVKSQQTAILGLGETVVRSPGRARVLAFGGNPVGPRYMWWNYIHSSLERLEEAKADWRAGRVPLPDGDTEAFTPAPPDEGRPLVRLNSSQRKVGDD